MSCAEYMIFQDVLTIRCAEAWTARMTSDPDATIGMAAVATRSGDVRLARADGRQPDPAILSGKGTAAQPGQTDPVLGFRHASHRGSP